MKALEKRKKPCRVVVIYTPKEQPIMVGTLMKFENHSMSGYEMH